MQDEDGTVSVTFGGQPLLVDNGNLERGGSALTVLEDGIIGGDDSIRFFRAADRSRESTNSLILKWTRS